MDTEKMGRFIAAQRKAKGMTQAELANELHITDKAVSKWERGLSSPDIGLLSQLAELLGVSVNDLLKGECTPNGADALGSDINEVLHYAKRSVQKEFGKIKLICSVCFTILLLIAIVVCAIVDVAISSRFTWSLYPISSIIFAWCVLFPFLLSGKKGIVKAMIALSALILPYLFFLDKISYAEGMIIKVGAVVAVISLIFLWSALLIMHLFRKRKLMGAGIVTIWAAFVSVLINASLSLVLTPAASVFDVWDVLDIFILVAAGLALICFDIILKNRKQK